MKKVLLALTVATVFVACDDSSKTKETTTDSTGVKKDTTPVTTPVDTTTVKVDTTKKMSADTSNKMKK